MTGTFVASINAQLSVGAVQETVTVTGETPLVDVQSVNRQTTMDNDLINAIPAARSYGGLMTLMPNTVVQGGAASNAQVVPNMVVFGGAGGRTNEGRLQVDGLSVGTAFNGAGVSAYVADVNNAQEVVLTSSGGMGEAEAGGPTLNIVPKEGGNRISGQGYFAQVTEGMIGSNYSDELKARGLTTPGSYTKIWDYNLRYRRPDHEGPAVVLPAGPPGGLREHHPRHVREPERRRPDQVVLHARPVAAGRRRGLVPDDRAAPDVATVGAEQDHGVLGRADPVRGRGLR